jgi:predicted transposase YdaD
LQHIVRNLLQQGMSVEQVATITGLPVTQIEQLSN